ncbi:hypothetical protein MRX96_019179 [Rhipicephalus microplus]
MSLLFPNSSGVLELELHLLNEFEEERVHDWLSFHRCIAMHQGYAGVPHEGILDFHRGTYPVIVVTAEAALGFHFRDVHHVINYELLQSIEECVHRLERTGLLGKLVRVTSFYDSDSNSALAYAFVKIFLSESQQKVPDWRQNEAKFLGEGGGGAPSYGGGGGGDNLWNGGGSRSAFASYPHRHLAVSV